MIFEIVPIFDRFVCLASGRFAMSQVLKFAEIPSGVTMIYLRPTTVL